MSQPGFGGNKRIVDINASSGVFIPVLAQSTVRRLVIKESPLTSAGVANTLIGLLQYKIPNDLTVNGFNTIFEAAGANVLTTQGNPQTATIDLGNPVSQRGMEGEIIGQVGQPIVGLPATAATTMVMLRSGGAATSVEITEYN